MGVKRSKESNHGMNFFQAQEEARLAAEAKAAEEARLAAEAKAAVEEKGKTIGIYEIFQELGIPDDALARAVPPRPGPAPTRQPRTPGGAAAGGAARRRAPSAYKRTAFLLWKLGCSSWGAKRRSCAYKHRHSEPSESLGLSEERHLC